jgi:predicted aldo/keto reductase-like oxidoreductase
MKYRKFGMTGWEASVLGFGVMRLPLINEDPALINEAESIRMIRYAIDHGVNYLDSGFPYDMKYLERLSRLAGQALQDGYREKVKVAATLPLFLINSPSDFDRYLNEQLQWVQINRIDFYLLGRLNRENWLRLQELGVLRWVEKAKTDGRIDRIGFFFHDHFQILRAILDAYDDWGLCQFQYSYMDVNHDPGVSGIKYAAEKGLGIVVTEPLRGGRLTKEPPESIAEIWANAQKKRTLTEWGLRWVWNHPEISVTLCDMSTIEQVVEDVQLADHAEPDSLTVQELVLISKVREAFRKLAPIPCPSCRACMPCLQGIDVPRIFELYNDAFIYDDAEMARSLYYGERHDLDSCTECRVCERACAKRLPMLDWLQKAHRLLTKVE